MIMYETIIYGDVYADLTISIVIIIIQVNFEKPKTSHHSTESFISLLSQLLHNRHMLKFKLKTFLSVGINVTVQ